MKWTNNKRFPNDKIGTIKDDISSKVQEVGARLEGFVSDESRGDESKDARQRGKEDVVRNQHLPHQGLDINEANHDIVQETSTVLDKEIVSTPESLAEKIVSQAMANTSTSDYTPLEIGSLKIERNSFYSHYFPLTPVSVTNRGCVQVKSKNFDFIQIIQRN